MGNDMLNMQRMVYTAQCTFPTYMLLLAYLPHNVHRQHFDSQDDYIWPLPYQLPS